MHLIKTSSRDIVNFLFGLNMDIDFPFYDDTVYYITKFDNKMIKFILIMLLYSIV